MSDVCLVIPPSPFLLDERVFVSLGILRVASAILQEGHRVEVLDLSGVSNYEEAAAAHMRTTTAKIIGVTATTPQMPAAHRTLLAMRSVASIGTHFVLGGPHPTLSLASRGRERKTNRMGRGHRAVEALAAWDQLVSGDGELAMLRILSGDRERVIDGDDPKSELFLGRKQLDELPDAARHLIDLDSYHYQIEGHRATSVIGQLGCPFKCLLGKTKIITSSGKNKKASDVVVGDKLVAMDEKTKEIVETNVDRVMVHEADDVYVIKFADGKEICPTAEHPFFVRESWIKVSDLKVGDEIYDITPRDKMSLSMKLRNPVRRAGVKEKISESVKKLFTDGVLNSDHLKSENRTDEFKENTRKFWESDRSLSVRESSRKRMIESNPMFDPEVASKARDTLIKRIEDGTHIPYMCTPEYWEKVAASPNRQEKEFLSILQREFGDRYKFVGDGTVRIGYYSPDFIDEESKKIIEYNGCWWHGCETCFPDKTAQRLRDKDRIRVYEEAGYKVKQIWSHELKDENSFLEELRRFTYNGAKIVSIEKLPGKHTVYNFECTPHHNYFANYLLSHNCTFCAGRYSPSLRKIRTRSVTNIVAEVENIHRVYGHTGIMFYDDELNVSKEMIPLMDALTDLQMRLGIEMRFRGFVKSELFDKKQAEAMRRAGFRWLLCGYESGSERILTNIEKQASRDQNTACVDVARAADLKIKALMSVGHAGESYETCAETERWLLEIKPDDFDVTVITPYPGSPYYDDAIETSPGVWTFSSPRTGDCLHGLEIDYNTTQDYYKGAPDGGYVSYVYTDNLTGEQLIKERDRIEHSVREKLGIPWNTSHAALRYEHSMGQGPLPPSMLRSAEPITQIKKRVSLPVLR